MLVVTSNYTPDEAEKRLNSPKGKSNRNAAEGVTGSRIISRIKGMCRLAYLGGNDRRRR
ncbi:MAG: hypothetical protein IJT73_08220 [Selenomonadaceae bacterium]|nr:hypothetical protein [Selenomonadaceae bacterium]